MALRSTLVRVYGTHRELAALIWHASFRHIRSHEYGRVLSDTIEDRPLPMIVVDDLLHNTSITNADRGKTYQRNVRDKPFGTAYTVTQTYVLSTKYRRHAQHGATIVRPFDASVLYARTYAYNHEHGMCLISYGVHNTTRTRADRRLVWRGIHVSES